MSQVGELTFAGRAIPAHRLERTLEVNAVLVRNGTVTWRMLSNFAERWFDTYVRADCASACVLVFAGGRERFVGEQARLGPHRSGVPWLKAEDGLSVTDREMQRFLLDQRVAPGFVEKGLKPSIFEMWEQGVEEVLESGLGARAWEDGASRMDGFVR